MISASCSYADSSNSFAASTASLCFGFRLFNKAPISTPSTSVNTMTGSGFSRAYCSVLFQASCALLKSGKSAEDSADSEPDRYSEDGSGIMVVGIFGCGFDCGCLSITLWHRIWQIQRIHWCFHDCIVKNQHVVVRNRLASALDSCVRFAGSTCVWGCGNSLRSVWSGNFAKVLGSDDIEKKVGEPTLQPLTGGKIIGESIQEKVDPRIVSAKAV
jgi:hypothetical protein